MRRARGVFLAAVWGLGVLGCAVQAQAAPRSALVSSGYTGQGIGVGSPLIGSVTVGWEFTAEADLWISELGFFDLGQDGLNISHDVGIWDQDHNLLVSATVCAGTAAPVIGEYRYASVAPVQLEAGHTFVIGATAPISMSRPPAFVTDMYPNDTLHIDPQGIVFDALIGLIAADRYFSDIQGGSSLDPLVFPTEHLPPSPWIDINTGEQIGTIDPYHFAPNFRFVPEPTAFSLLAVGALLLPRRPKGGRKRVGQ